jgi:hypothetical protein
MAPLYQRERCFASVILKYLHRCIVQNLNSSAAHYYGVYFIDSIEHSVESVANCGHNAVKNQRCFVINFVTTRSEFHRRLPTDKTASTLRLCCLFGNSMEYSATWDVMTDQVMYNLLNLTKHADSVSRSECLALLTAVTIVNINVLGLGLCLCLSNSNTLFLLIVHFRFFNITV